MGCNCGSKRRTREGAEAQAGMAEAQAAPAQETPRERLVRERGLRSSIGDPNPTPAAPPAAPTLRRTVGVR